MSFLIIALFLIMPYEVSKSAKQALLMCIESVIPALFPFMVAAKCAVISKDIKEDNFLFRIIAKIFNIPLCGVFAFLSGLICGYPVGAKTAFELYRDGRITRKEAVRLASFSNNAGPAFVISVVGGLISGSGLIIYISHISSSIIMGLLLRGKEKPSRINSPAKSGYSLSDAIPKALCDSGLSVINITAAIMFFSALSSVVVKLIPAALTNTPLKQGLIFSFFEITSGIRLIAESGISHTAKMMISSFLISFSGLSVIFQTKSFASGTDIKTAPCILCKVLSGIISVFICYILQ